MDETTMHEVDFFSSHTNEKNLHLCTCLTNSYRRIYNGIFLNTLSAVGSNDFDAINVLQILDEEATPGSTGQKNFRKINYRKLHFIYQQVKSHLGDNLMFLDLDVVFFSNFKQEINNLLESNDMVLQDNDDWLNVGVWAMNCNEKVVTFFEEHVLPLSEVLLKDLGTEKHNLFGTPHDYVGDQDVVNVAIRKSDIKAAALPIKYYSNHLKDYKFPDYVPEGCVLFHATNCGSGETRKINMLAHAFNEITERR